MRALITLAMLIGCGGNATTGDECPGCGELERACHEIANRWCCEFEPGTPKHAECHLEIKHAACYGPIGGAPEAGCQVERCVRSSVDFAACGAAIDAIENQCIAVCNEFEDLPDCVYFPRECRTEDCPTPDSGCVEDPVGWVETSP